MRIITLTTDFGDEDGYVGTMKGVILSIAPEVRLVDLSHHIPPQDIRRAAFVVAEAAPYFPPGTIHVAVVDPGVGSARRALIVETERALFVGPDNGLFSFILDNHPEARGYSIEEPAYRLPQVSYTFHGRDVFAPAAAYLARGVPPAAFGPPVTDPVRLPPPRLELSEERIGGEILHADRFGNLVTSIGRLQWQGATLVLQPAFGPLARRFPVVFRAKEARVEIGDRIIQGIVHTFAEGQPGELIAYPGSSGFLEIGLVNGCAAAALEARRGDPVVVRARLLSLE
ncbi:MAG: SAM-dependent chlorinase/fluorinase [Thermoflexus sp.]|uniref:SAM hydrolase/SAM-dependent halogenase family protein n=1 Tax=Thermoflexus sp. TaxID=1969742 RepID=UPI0025D2403E|nr:SAM-dependent chlorinase/fluorinase [Thermoflexus sp.]MCS6962715.1 SAM-dependent chlorinase/fluorinase [Thermoflexus sp.]